MLGLIIENFEKIQKETQETEKSGNDFFDELEKYWENSGISIDENQKRAIKERMDGITDYEPRIGIFGKTGVGKSSLCNALFGTDVCPISDVEACTRHAKEVMLNLTSHNGIKLVDVPGVGESKERDEEYAKLYVELLPELDVVLWLLKGDDRAYSSDEAFYNNIVKPHIEQGKPFFFVLNQVDKIPPFRDWDEEKHEPGAEQFRNIDRKVQTVAGFFDVPASKVIPVSAHEKYNMVKLVDEIVFALPKEKKVTVYNHVNDEFRSGAADDDIGSSYSFLDAVEDVAVDAGMAVLEKVFDIADWLDDPCYITTAVCKDSGKPDNCYELTQFRAFRDNWLEKQPDGKKLIEQYYNTAPDIVKKIERQPNKHEIYQNLRDTYLSPCLKYIEDEKYEECKELYSDMVYSLYDESKKWS
jgi:hypothetical protein